MGNQFLTVKDMSTKELKEALVSEFSKAVYNDYCTRSPFFFGEEALKATEKKKIDRLLKCINLEKIKVFIDLTLIECEHLIRKLIKIESGNIIPIAKSLYSGNPEGFYVADYAIRFKFLVELQKNINPIFAKVFDLPHQHLND